MLWASWPTFRLFLSKATPLSASWKMPKVPPAMNAACRTTPSATSPASTRYVDLMAPPQDHESPHHAQPPVRSPHGEAPAFAPARSFRRLWGCPLAALYSGVPIEHEP